MPTCQSLMQYLASWQNTWQVGKSSDPRPGIGCSLTWPSWGIDVPEQSSDTLIPEGQLLPGHVFAIGRSVEGDHAVYKLENKAVAGSCKFHHEGVSSVRSARESIDAAWQRERRLPRGWKRRRRRQKGPGHRRHPRAKTIREENPPCERQILGHRSDEQVLHGREDHGHRLQT